MLFVISDIRVQQQVSHRKTWVQEHIFDKTKKSTWAYVRAHVSTNGQVRTFGGTFPSPTLKRGYIFSGNVTQAGEFYNVADVRHVPGVGLDDKHSVTVRNHIVDLVYSTGSRTLRPSMADWLRIHRNDVCTVLHTANSQTMSPERFQLQCPLKLRTVFQSAYAALEMADGSETDKHPFLQCYPSLAAFPEFMSGHYDMDKLSEVGITCVADLTVPYRTLAQLAVCAVHPATISWLEPFVAHIDGCLSVVVTAEQQPTVGYDALRTSRIQYMRAKKLDKLFREHTRLATSTVVRAIQTSSPKYLALTAEERELPFGTTDDTNPTDAAKDHSFTFFDHGEFVSPSRLFRIESQLAEELRRFMGAARQSNSVGIPDLDALFDQDPRLAQLDKTQRQAVRNVYAHPVSTISGGAGVGKSSTVLGILSVACHAGMRCLMGAPTGQAVQRLRELTVTCAPLRNYALRTFPEKDSTTTQGGFYPPATLHRWHTLLRAMNSDAKGFPAGGSQTSAKRTCPVPARVRVSTGKLHKEKHILILDEQSMQSYEILLDVLVQLRVGGLCVSHLVFLGDNGQLPCVGTGALFRDLLQLKIAIPHTELTTIYRTHHGSREIAENSAHLRDRDWAFTESAAFASLQWDPDVFARNYWESSKLSAQRIMVLAYSNETVAMLNYLLHRTNPETRRVNILGLSGIAPVKPNARTPEIRGVEILLPAPYISWTFHSEDPVVNIVNIYDRTRTLLVANGEIGKVEWTCSGHQQNRPDSCDRPRSECLPHAQGYETCLEQGFVTVVFGQSSDKTAQKTPEGSNECGVPADSGNEPYYQVYPVSNRGAEVVGRLGNDVAGGVNSETSVTNGSDRQPPQRPQPVRLTSHLRPAYATTIHKSQGSESEQVHVVIIGTESKYGSVAFEPMSVNALYTAITRAKSRCLLYSRSPQLLQQVRQSACVERTTGFISLFNGLTRFKSTN